MKCPVLVHVNTTKGLGYEPAQQDPAKFHGIGKFDPATGNTLSPKVPNFSDSFGEAMMALAEEDPRVCAITAAMPGGTGLLKFRKKFPKRTFDVGIAEEHAVSMAGGLAKQGMVPVVALYSTFLQRSYDQIIQDVAMLKLHVVFAIDRAGLVGDDGETHHGVFDVGFLRQIPNMTVLCPVSQTEQKDMLHWAVREFNGPVAVRYPRGGDGSHTGSDWNPDRMMTCHREGEDVTFITYGTIFSNVQEAADLLESQGIRAGILRLQAVAPLNMDQIIENLSSSRHVIVVEEVCADSGIRQEIGWQLNHRLPQCKVDGIDLGHNFVTHGSTAELYRHHGLDAQAIAKFTQEVLGK